MDSAPHAKGSSRAVRRAARPGRMAGALVISGCAGIAALLLALLFLNAPVTRAAQLPRLLPPPALDEPAGRSVPEIAVLAGGCFWGVQGVYQHVAGVLNAVSGYAGGSKSTALYDVVSTGSTGHAESVQISYDPRRISYGTLLQLFFSVVHDPTELNAQGPDEGSQYRSAIFPQNPEQARIAAAYIAQLRAAHAFATPIVTVIEPGRAFYPAESYHQNYLATHRSFPYIMINDLPKVAALRRLFPQRYRSSAVLVAQANPSH